jgi:hypothetical protein
VATAGGGAGQRRRGAAALAGGTEGSWRRYAAALGLQQLAAQLPPGRLQRGAARGSGDVEQRLWQAALREAGGVALQHSCSSWAF